MGRFALPAHKSFGFTDQNDPVNALGVWAEGVAGGHRAVGGRDYPAQIDRAALERLGPILDLNNALWSFFSIAACRGRDQARVAQSADMSAHIILIFRLFDCRPVKSWKRENGKTGFAGFAHKSLEKGRNDGPFSIILFFGLFRISPSVVHEAARPVKRGLGGLKSGVAATALPPHSKNAHLVNIPVGARHGPNPEPAKDFAIPQKRLCSSRDELRLPTG
jgi:hypothetical protein